MPSALKPAPAAWEALPPAYRPPDVAPSLPEAEAYCRRLARSHYENFSVVTWFLPRALHQHFFNVYAYCRISDDLGDEAGSPADALALLDYWESELEACYAGAPRHPVFVALAETVRRFDIPRQEFADLLRAFRQDQSVTRYATFDDLLGYCRYSANPVGHLVLYLGGYREEERRRLADSTCTALQLANFWQDVAVDYSKGRIYLPQEDMERYSVGEEEIAVGRATPSFRHLMRFEVERARAWFQRGLPLAGMVSRELATDIELFTRGGQAILEAIERHDYDVLSRRPVVTGRRKLWLALRAAAGRLA